MLIVLWEDEYNLICKKPSEGFKKPGEFHQLFLLCFGVQNRSSCSVTPNQAICRPHISIGQNFWGSLGTTRCSY